MSIKQLTIFVENKPGRLTEIFEILAEVNIDIRAVSVGDTKDFGILRLIVSDPEAAVKETKKREIAAFLTDVIAIGREDKPGVFAKALRLLSEGGIAVEYIYAAISKKPGTAYVILRVDDNERAADVLKNGGVELLSNNEVYGG